MHNSINYAELYKIVSDKLKAAFKKWKNSDGVYERLFEGLPKSNAGKAEKEKAAVEKRLAVLNVKVNNLYEDYANDALSAENYRRILSESQKEQETLNKRLNQLNEELNKEVDHAANFKKLKETAERFVNFTELTTDMLYQLIERIEVSPKIRQDNGFTQEVNIIYRFIGESIS